MIPPNLKSNSNPPSSGAILQIWQKIWQRWRSCQSLALIPLHKRSLGRYGRRLLALVLGFVIALVSNFPLAAVGNPNLIFGNNSATLNGELRGVWLTDVDSDVLFSRSNLWYGIYRMKRLNINTMYPTVWHEGYTLYPSAVAERSFGAKVDPIPELQNRDMLAEAVEMGHKRGLAVIPWFEFGLMSEERSDLTYRHPDWLTQRQDGTQVYVSGDRNQHRFVWMNPLRPEVQQLLVDLITEAVTKYDVDGVQLDDHFGLPVELGYDSYTIALYQSTHNGKMPPTDINDPEWVRWRADYVTQLMGKIASAVKAVKPKCIISLSPNPRKFSYAKYMQDWGDWVNRGWLDEVIVQVYRSDLANFEQELDSPDLVELRPKVPISIGILTGLRIQNVDMSVIKAQVEATRRRNFAGFSFFFYETLGNRNAGFLSFMPSAVSRPRI
ncbi:MAG: glycoside hydrolase family 10 protein [Pseudanabaenaceae cyanobacterium]|jgi:uncharacterized lipoprotein YddW (UPF0748 family)